VTAITDEKTISGETNGSEVFPMKTKPSTLAPKSEEPTVLIPIEVTYRRSPAAYPDAGFLKRLL
jgi:hypothetical protein